MRNSLKCLLLVAVLLSLSQRDSTAECMPVSADPVGWWQGDGNAIDVAGSNNGVLKNGATFGTGFQGEAFSFDGIDDYVELPPAVAQSIPEDFTVSAWIYPRGSKICAIACDFTVFIRGTDLDDGWGAQLSRRPDNVMCFGVVVPDSNGQWVQVNICSSKEMCIEQWHHVVGVRRGTSIEIWVDGQINSGSTFPGPLRGTGRSFIGWGGPNPFAQSGDDFFFNGLIDEVTVYNRALALSEILETFNCKVLALLQHLTDTVVSLNLRAGIEDSLDAKLDAAMHAMEDVNQNNGVAACGSLQAFINAVEAQRDNQITSAQANTLSAEAQTIMNLVCCNP
ncbi:MAG: LamG domain-containing protein [Verrucomicrobia bacterium]|nr:LamG domain-containing protein [Verrucomicrobiota bacterium]